SGVIGVGRAVRAEPDGYTVSVGNWPTHVVNGAAFALPYDLLRDIEPVALLSSNPYLIVARNGLPAKDLSELIAVLKARISSRWALPGSVPGSMSVEFIFRAQLEPLFDLCPIAPAPPIS